MSSETSHPTGPNEARVMPRKRVDDSSLEKSHEERLHKTPLPEVSQCQQSEDVKVGAALPECAVDAMAETNHDSSVSKSDRIAKPADKVEQPVSRSVTADDKPKNPAMLQNTKPGDRKDQALAQKKAFDDRFVRPSLARSRHNCSSRCMISLQKRRGKRPLPPREAGEAQDPSKKPKRELSKLFHLLWQSESV
jgi:hypothetical protein